MNLEPKVTSYLYLPLHNALLTGEKLRIWSKGRFDQSQAKTEASLANTILPTEGLFVKCKNGLKEKITRGSKHLKKRDTWDKIKPNWFSIGPGGKATFNNS
ncbi:hypothetical protein AYI69_g10111 [Smittium culicis]|uniref:Uncharacterized protein n=1 Tax=Smittium culicis TaxID=133412 RepID=A0A1R1X7Z5_9FUNG|nr:hypothetical protein AYI69_g10111 [Smittium culicis]